MNVKPRLPSQFIRRRTYVTRAASCPWHTIMVGALLITCASVSSFGAETKLDPAHVEFFEKKIRPVLVEKCYTCHSAGFKIKGGLSIDSKPGMLKGGETGPAVIPGDPDKSLMMKAVRYKDDELKMPPKDPLPPDVIANLEAWIKMGAPDPREEPSSAPVAIKTINFDEAKQFWSFQKPKAYAQPKVAQQNKLQSPVDAFVIAKLEEKGLKISAPADKRTLIRRATYDLIGLAPTPEEIAAFENDSAPDAFAKVVDRLLASPHYGEKWARHWLDISRYADTKGYVFQEERRYPYSYTYRDWVIAALNEDMPYDQFVTYQLAADRICKDDATKKHLAAMGFLTLGRRFINVVPDIIDDRIDVTFRGLQGLTVTCARCHDHKYDPFPTKDYYSLYGVFNSSNEPKDLPEIGKPQDAAAYEQYLSELKKSDADVADLKMKKLGERLTAARKADKLGDYLLASREAKKIPDPQVKELAGKKDLNGYLLERWKKQVSQAEAAADPVLASWIALADLKDADFAAKSKDIIANTKNPLVKKALTDKPVATLKDAALAYGNLLSSVAQDKAFPEADKEALRQTLYGPKAAFNVPVEDADKVLNRDDENKIRDLRKKSEALKITHPGAPPCAMVMLDNPKPSEPKVFVRGNPNNQGEQIPRHFLSVLNDVWPENFKDGSGRLELAKAIANPNNPLTARVIVNRVWAQHFGTGLVRTASDFGIRGDKPTHPELLDDMAVRFMSEGWSLKKLHRSIMLSYTYQQASDDIAEDRAVDSENSFLWRQNRRRLDFEGMRDSLLQAAGHLDPSIGGKPANFIENPTMKYKMEGELVKVTTDDPSKDRFSLRRSVYLFIDRQNLPGLFRTFDFASPDTHSPRRFNTTVPQQALFMMNGPFVVEQAREVLKRPEIAREGDQDRKIAALYSTIFGRKPEGDEIKLAQSFLSLGDSANQPVAPAKASPWSYGFGEYDEGTKKLKSFTKFAFQDGETQQIAPKLPDAKWGYSLINREGGHPGNDSAHASIRRWTAPEDGTITIKGKLKHPNKEGDGVRGRAVSSDSGLIGEWTALNNEVDAKADNVKVKAGDTIDFVVDCKGNPNFDAFTWAPIISFKAASGAVTEHNAKNDYNKAPAKPPVRLSAWEKYVQVLLLSNEFMFVD